MFPQAQDRDSGMPMSPLPQSVRFLIISWQQHFLLEHREGLRGVISNSCLLAHLESLQAGEDFRSRQGGPGLLKLCSY